MTGHRDDPEWQRLREAYVSAFDEGTAVEGLERAMAAALAMYDYEVAHPEGSS